MTGAAPVVERVPPLKPLSPMQYAVVVLLGIGMSHEEVAATLRIKRSVVRSYMREALKKIPGDLPAEARLVAWVRGASLDVLEGTSLRVEFLRDAVAGRVSVPAAIAGYYGTSL